MTNGKVRCHKLNKLTKIGNNNSDSVIYIDLLLRNAVVQSWGMH